MAGQVMLKGAWGITFLLFLYMLVNFADKVIVGLAGVPIMTELKLSPEQFGFLGSAFFFLFAISGLLVGLIANKRPTRWILLSFALVWALVQFPMLNGEAGFTTLLICRIILGAGEGPAFAVAVHALYKWFPDEKRALPTAILSQGSAIGVIVAVPALNWVIVHYGWRWAFGALGLVGLMWALAWLMLGREGPLVDETRELEEGRRYSFGRLMATPTFIGVVLGDFRRLLGAVAGADLVHAVSGERAGHPAGEGGVDLRVPMAGRSGGGAGVGIYVAADGGARRDHAARARGAGRGAAAGGGSVHAGAALCGERDNGDRAAGAGLGLHRRHLSALSAHARRVHADGAARRRAGRLWRVLFAGGRGRAHGHGPDGRQSARRFSDRLSTERADLSLPASSGSF